jgi:transposase, IS30 family
MSRGKSALAKEIKRGTVGGVYDPDKAHHKAYKKRKYAKYQAMKIISHSELRSFVEKALMDDQSPANIAGRITHHEKNLPSVSKDIIYKFIQSPYGRQIEYKRKKQKSKNKQRAVQKEKLKDRTFIDKRPKIIAQMKRIGDTEADFIVSCKGGRGILLTVIDRKSRKPYIEKILPVTIPNTHRAFQRIKRRFPEMKTITTDNDLLFQHHRELEKLLNAKMYFCHPYHSWEKGSVENLNKLIRKDIPKGSDVSKYSRYVIQKTEDKLSRHFYECLHFRTPAEVIERHRVRKKRL